MLLAAIRREDIKSLHIVSAGGNRASTTPLHEAAKTGHVVILTIVANASGVLIDAVNEDSRTPLHIAAAGDHLDAVGAQVDLGASLLSLNRGEAPLHLAVTRGSMKVATAPPRGRVHAGALPRPRVVAQPPCGPRRQRLAATSAKVVVQPDRSTFTVMYADRGNHGAEARSSPRSSR